LKSFLLQQKYPVSNYNIPILRFPVSCINKILKIYRKLAIKHPLIPVDQCNIVNANNVKNFEDFAYHLVSIARELHSSENFKIQGIIYAFDSSTIDICLNVFWWAKSQKAKGGIKLHNLYDINIQKPAFIHITSANVHHVKAKNQS